ncbi:Vgb family protein [Thermosulfidibacter takaii]|nr:hypothetical protein [Thermosulfidibacter takaii]
MRMWLCIVLSIVIIPHVSVAGAPWKWVMSMGKDSSGVHLRNPTDLYYDRRVKRFYVVDSGNNRLISFDHRGQYLSQFNAGGQLKGPFSMVKDEKGNIWVVEKEVNSLTYIDLKKKTVERHVLHLPNGAVVFPDRLGLDSQGNLYLLDRASGKILVLDKELRVLRYYASSDGGSFCDFKIKGDGVWALEPLHRKVYHFSLDGRLLDKIELKYELSLPISLEVAAGFIYILDRSAGEIRVFDTEGRFKYAFLEKGESRGKIYYPFKLLFDDAGRLCVVEEGNGRVEVFKR